MLNKKYRAFIVLVLFFIFAVEHGGCSKNYYPALAMHCGKATQHRDIVTGDWISGSIDCIKDKMEMLQYCKKVYDTLIITNVLDDSETVHIGNWCPLRSEPRRCKGHKRTVRPVKCIIGNYEPKALDVREGCEFQHKIEYDGCQSPQYWETAAGQECRAKGKTLSDHQMLKPCSSDIDKWEGVQFLCCNPPDVAKPKPNKGKKVSTTIRDPVGEVETTDKQSDDVLSICLQPKKVGLCRALLPAWHFNVDTQECEFFHYGGCGGNQNNFKSRAQCESKCQPGKVVKPAIKQDNSFCGLPSDAGMCLAYFERFYYDSNAASCKKFVYGGCGGNGNNFVMKEDCEKGCKGFKRISAGATDPALPLPVHMPQVDFGLGPVILDKDGKPAKAEETAPTTSPFYTDKTTIENEHEVFANKLEEMQAEHQAKVDKIVENYDKENPEPSSETETQISELKERLQEVITTLENEYEANMSALNKFHMDRMDKMIAETRAKTYLRFLDQLRSDKPKLRHILTSLEKYINVERNDKTHVMQHFYMAVNDDFKPESIPDLKNQINEIDARVNKTRNVLSNYPDLLARVSDEVEEILATVPQSPDFDEYEDYNDLEEEVMTDGFDVSTDTQIKTTTMITTTETGQKIDDGGIPDPDICDLKPVMGPCRAAIPMFYYDAVKMKCEVFYYGGCDGNDNKFRTLEECQSVCTVGYERPFDDVDVNGVLASEDVLPEEKPFDKLDVPRDSFDINSIKSSEQDSEEDEEEDESRLDEDVDKQFYYDGRRKNGYEVVQSGPQHLSFKVRSASIASKWFVWVGLAAGCILIAGAVIIIVLKNRTRNSAPMTITANKPEEDKEMTPEEKQLLALQQNGYENPTYKFFEKQQIA